MKKIISNIILGILVVLVLLKVVPMLLGYQMYVIESNSMEPTYPVGSLVVVKPCSFDEIEVGDVITFNQASSIPKTHRVTAIDTQRARFTTKGDNNQEEDAQKVALVALIGKVVIGIPFVGYIYFLSQSIIGIVVIVVLALISVIFSRKE